MENLFKQNNRPVGRIVRLLSDEERAVRKKSFQVVAVAAVFLLGFIATLGFIKRQTAVKEQPVISLEKKANYVLTEIAGLAKVDPGRAMGLAADLNKSISDSQKDISDKKMLNRLNALLQKLDSLQSELGLARKIKLTEFLDPKLLRDGLNAEILSGNAEKLLIFDPRKNILATVSPVDRSGQIIGGGIEGINSFALGRNSAFGIKDSRIVEFPFSGGETLEAVKDDGAWSGDSIVSWFGGNLYVIDKSGSEILKYPALENTSGKSEFGSRRRWFKPGINYDLSDIVGAEVDGDIWILHQDGRISRFRNGSKITYKQVLADFMSEPVLFSVPLEGDKIWVLSRKEKKVVVLNKETGEFAGEWETEEFGKAQGLAVNEKLGKMFVLVEGKIYVANTQ
ncbi:hypothetical protein HZB78_02845 [Candidatus Collierbacteria bacterium]|nr:hypothetical protein [Candidatus Collierbacteria bacterium]